MAGLGGTPSDYPGCPLSMPPESGATAAGLLTTLGGSGHLCRFGWSCPDSLRLDLKRVLLHFDLSGCGQDLCVFVGFVWIWAGFERIPLDSS